MHSSLDPTIIPRCLLCGLDTSNSCFAIPPSSPVAIEPLFRSNTPPAPHAEALVKGHLSRIRDGIDTLGAAITNLQKARARLEHEHAKHTGLISPVRRIPPEILSQIFSFYKEAWWESLRKLEFGNEWEMQECTTWEVELDGIHSCEDDQTNLEPYPPRVVSQVCRSWREASRKCSSLWSDVYLNDDSNTIAAQALIAEQVALSRGQCLRIFASRRVLDLSCFGPLFRCVQGTHERWSSLSVQFIGASYPLLIPNTRPPIFPSLISLSLHFQWKSPSSYHLSAANAPLLTEVSISWEDAQETLVDLPWAQLHQLRVANPSKSQIFAIIRGLQAIQELHLIRIDSVIPSNDAWEIVSLPFLHYLKISSSTMGILEPVPGNILRYLHLPALRTVIWIRMLPDDEIELINMLKRSSPQGDSVLLPELFIFSPDESFCRGFTRPLEDMFTALLSNLEVFHFECPSPSGFKLGEVVNHLSEAFETGGASHLHKFTVQGAIINTRRILDLVEHAEKQNTIEIRLLNCAIDPKELHEYTSVSDIIFHFDQLLSNNTRMELDIEGPDHKRLVYTQEFGVRIEEGCWCGSGINERPRRE